MAFSKQNATATNVGPKAFDNSPSNYTSLGTLLDPTKPDVRDLYVQTFGDQGITGLLDVTGAKRSAGTADEVHWYEEGRINRKLTATLTTSTDLLTITHVDGVAIASVDPDYADNYIRPNDVLLAASGRRYIVTGTVSDSAWTAVVKDMDGTAVGTVAAQDFTIIGNAWGQGTSQPAKPFEMSLKLRKNPYIIAKETFHVNGSQASNIGWLNVNGQNMWYLKGEMDARKKFMNTREAMLVFGQSNVVGTGATAGDNGTGAGITTANGVVTGSEGYFQAVQRRGIVSTVAADQDFGVGNINDLDNILILLDAEGAPSEYAMYVNRATSLNIDDMLAGGSIDATANLTAGLAAQYGAFNNSSDMAVQLGFKSFQRGGYTFHKHDWKLLNDPYQGGHTDFNGALIPLANVVDPKTGGSNPSLEMNYKSAGNYSREMEHWVEGGGVLGYATNGDDVAKFHYRSECNLCVRAANQHVLLQAGA
jgi:hypothetical protein